MRPGLWAPKSIMSQQRRIQSPCGFDYRVLRPRKPPSPDLQVDSSWRWLPVRLSPSETLTSYLDHFPYLHIQQSDSFEILSAHSPPPLAILYKVSDRSVHPFSRSPTLPISSSWPIRRFAHISRTSARIDFILCSPTLP